VRRHPPTDETRSTILHQVLRWHLDEHVHWTLGDHLDVCAAPSDLGLQTVAKGVLHGLVSAEHARIDAHAQALAVEAVAL
jgi:hypothetical protein